MSDNSSSFAPGMRRGSARSGSVGADVEDDRVVPLVHQAAQLLGEMRAMRSIL